MKSLPFLLLLSLLLAACGHSEEEQMRLSREEQQRLWREDSAAFKVAVMPTLDCLPIIVAHERHFFDSTKADVRLRMFTAHMDCDTALMGGSVQAGVSELVRAQRLVEEEGTRLRWLTATPLSWQLVSNRLARVRQLRQLDEKMLATCRFSASELFGLRALDSAKVEVEHVYRPQVNDVHVRLNMLLGNEIDAVLLPEPQATEARGKGHRVLCDCADTGLRLGVVALNVDQTAGKERQRQLEEFVRGYNQAVDSINGRGMKVYSSLIQNYCKVHSSTVDSLPPVHFTHVAPPRQRDIDAAHAWLMKRLGEERDIRKATTTTQKGK